MRNQFEISTGILEQLEGYMKIIIIIFSPALSRIGILIGDEDYHENADQVVVRIRLLGIEETEWLIQNDCRC